MKTFWSVLIFSLLMCFSFSGCVKKYDTTVTVEKDGKVHYKAVAIISRKVAESMVGLAEKQEQAQNAADNEDKDDDKNAEAVDSVEKSGETEKVEPLSEDEQNKQLAEKLKRVLQKHLDDTEYSGVKIESVKVEKESVEIEAEADYDSLAEFVVQSPKLLSYNGIKRVKLEKNNDGKLKFGFYPPLGIGSERSLELFRKRIYSNKCKLSLTLNLPGKILSSGFTSKKDNSTTISVDAENEEDLENYMSIMGGPIEVVAEPGELALDFLPIDSMALLREKRNPQLVAGEKLPVTEATEPYEALGLHVKTQFVHRFGSSAKVIKEHMTPFSSEKNYCEVRAFLVAPGERHILNLERVEIIKAVDDRGREVKKLANSNDNSGDFGISSNDSHNQVARFSLFLEPPESDARAVERLDGMAILLVFDKWKTQTISKLKSDADAKIDLSEVLTGAALTITKIKGSGKRERNLDGSIEFKVTGPKEILHLDFKVMSNADNNYSYVRKNQPRMVNGKLERAVSLSYNLRNHSVGKIGNLQLQVSYPEGLKRERTRFTLQALDMF